MRKEAANAMFDDEDELEDSQDENEGSNRIAWFISGVLLGATLAILYAPKSGAGTRQFLTEKTQRGKAAVADAVADKGKDIADSGIL